MPGIGFPLIDALNGGQLQQTADLVTAAAETPPAPQVDEVRGIHQSDIIIRSALIAAMEDMRANPWLLDHAFASLPKDSLTSSEYGQREIDAAKKWFLKDRIPVFMSTRIDQAVFPCISISLVDSVEAEVTFSDTHYVVAQDDDRVWPALTRTFVPDKWDPVTGYLTVPQDIASSVALTPGMQVVGKDGTAHEILSLVDGTNLTVVLAAAPANLDEAVIKGKPPAQVAKLESVRAKETYSIGCHVQGEQTHLTYLHSILLFILYRYKASLLEARGFERSVVSSSDFRRNEAFENELTFSRHVNLTGYVTHVWPADVTPKVTSVSTAVGVDGAGKLPSEADPNDSLWVGDQDLLLIGLK